MIYFSGMGSLKNYYEENFALMHHHKWALSEVESMTPLDKEIYTKLLSDHLEKLEEEYNKNKR